MKGGEATSLCSWRFDFGTQDSSDAFDDVK